MLTDHSYREMISLDDLPDQAGSYALLFNLPAPVRRVIGRLGAFDFPGGDYLYFGSAHGAGGLRSRIRHHARVTDHPHWHLDWLRPDLNLTGVWTTTAPGNWECAWSQAISRLPGAAIPAPGFGAADCRRGCAAHLVVFPGKISAEAKRNLATTIPGRFKIEYNGVTSYVEDVG